MPYIVFSFDTEDYVNPQGVDGILRCAEILRKEGIRGCFNVVAKLAEALGKWGRTDVIEALKYHEIDTHSYAHSMHPTINEYTDIEDYEEAKKRFFQNEWKARDILYHTFGVDKLPAACPPGASTSYVAHYGYAEMGIPVYCGDYFVDEVRGRNIWSCNILCTDYHHYLDRYLIANDTAQIDADFEKIAQEKDMYVLAHHPQMAIVDEFCDMVNFYRGNTPEKEWKLSRRKPKEDTETFYAHFEYLVKKLKKDPRFKIITYEDLANIYCRDERVITADDIAGLKAQLDEYFFPVTTPDSFCVSDIFLACRDLLLGKPSHTCGTVYGFLEEPYAVSEAVTVSAPELRASAASIGDGFLPQRIRVGSAELGPADWLRAALEVLCGAKSVMVTPASWQIDMTQFPKIRDLNLKGSWIHTLDFEDRYLSHRMRQQSWTYRLPKHTKRTIF